MSTSDDLKPPKRGRPKSNRVATQIRLEKVVFDAWQTKKDRLGFGDKSLIASSRSICCPAFIV